MLPSGLWIWATFDNFGSTNLHDAHGIRHNLYIISLTNKNATPIQNIVSAG